MEKTNQKVPFTVKNIMKCICVCVAYPVQGTSKCVNEKMEKVKEMMKSWGGGMVPKPKDVPGLYCASGATSCKDIDTQQLCICGDCPIWIEYNLPSGEPMGYYCREGKAK